MCHANKRYEACQWETPYGRTVQFDRNTRQAESGRLQYFGFSDMDCGIVIKDIGVRDSGGWTCRVSARVAGKPQVSADIVRLFVGKFVNCNLSNKQSCELQCNSANGVNICFAIELDPSPRALESTSLQS